MARVEQEEKERTEREEKEKEYKLKQEMLERAAAKQKQREEEIERKLEEENQRIKETAPPTSGWRGKERERGEVRRDDTWRRGGDKGDDKKPAEAWRSGKFVYRARIKFPCIH